MGCCESSRANSSRGSASRSHVLCSALAERCLGQAGAGPTYCLHLPKGTTVSQHDQETGQARAPVDKGQEEIENYGSRREDEADELPSPSSQIGRASQSGGTPESGRQLDEGSREGWPMP